MFSQNFALKGTIKIPLLCRYFDFYVKIHNKYDVFVVYLYVHTKNIKQQRYFYSTFESKIL